MNQKRTHALLPFALAGALISTALGGCNPEPSPVAGNCNLGEDCVGKNNQLLSIDKLDILLVVDNSPSVKEDLERFKSELPRMLTAFVDGNDRDAGKFPPVQSVNLALLTSDMGLGEYGPIDDDSDWPVDYIPGKVLLRAPPPNWNCDALGDDGLFYIYADADIQHCDPTRPSYLSFRGDAATVSAVDSIGCIPNLGYEGCGFEQPLEAALKALSPADSNFTFNNGKGHGDGPHAGFLRDDSLLVVIVVTDEDDCSMGDAEALFTELESSGSYNLYCTKGDNHLHPVSRYAEGLKALRPTENDVIVAVIAGIPPTLTAESAQGTGNPDDYFDAVLSDPTMEKRVAPSGKHLMSSCISTSEVIGAKPPRRLVELAQSFGSNGVLGSICDDDFGSSVGNIMRTVAERLRTAAPTESAE